MVDSSIDAGIDPQSLSDQNGRILKDYLDHVRNHLKLDGIFWFCICSNTSYEVLADTASSLRLISAEMVGTHFWRAIIAGSPVISSQISS